MAELSAGSFWNPSCSVLQGLKPTVGAFFTMMFTLMMVSYTATSMALAIAAGQSVVAVANLLMTVAFVFMIVSSTVQFSRLDHETPKRLKSRNPSSMEFSWILQKSLLGSTCPDLSDLSILMLWGGIFWFVLWMNEKWEGWIIRRRVVPLFLCGSGRQKTVCKVRKPLRATFPSLSLNFVKDKCVWLRTWPAAPCFWDH